MTRQELNRATLARQMLLARENVTPLKAVERLAGLQAQEAKHPFIGLWTRVEGFGADDLRGALQRRSLVRATMLRATLHLMSAKDYAALRTAIQPVLTRAMGAIKDRSEGLELDKLLPVARKLLDEEPRDFNDLRAALLEAFPKVNERALGYAVRTNLPLVMVPTDDRWGFPAKAKFTLAETWIDKPLASGDEATQDLVRRYLAAFGPATPADMHTWSGLQGMKAVFEELRPKLKLLEDERGRELFDLPRAPRPSADVEAPPRFLPEFDNLVLGHAERTRVLADEHRGEVVTKNLRVRATFLYDGFVRGTWSIERKKDVATLQLAPFEKLPRGAAGKLKDEGSALLRFAEPEAAKREVRV